MRGRNGTSTAAQELTRLRRELQRIDREIVDLLARRVQVARAAGAVKRSAGLPLVDLAREAAVVRQAATLASERGLDEESVRHVFWSLIELARGAQVDED
jgi:prephenate dehydrogenase